MKTDNVILEKSYAFAIRIVMLHRHLVKTTHHYDLARQILKSGTSVGANIEEAIGGNSRKEFVHKLSIAYRETRETRFWIRLFRDTQILSTTESESLLSDCEELLKIIGTIIKTTKNNS